MSTRIDYGKQHYYAHRSFLRCEGEPMTMWFLLFYALLWPLIELGRLHGLAATRWTTDHYHPCSNLGVGMSEGCFVSLPLEVARPIQPTLCEKVAVKHQPSSS